MGKCGGTTGSYQLERSYNLGEGRTASEGNFTLGMYGPQAPDV